MSEPYATRERSEVLPSFATRVLVLCDNRGATYFVEPGAQAVIGRHLECGIRIELPSVSRRHARMSRAADTNALTIEDIGGMNGVRVRGQRLTPNTPVPIAAGDVIELGGAMILLHAPLVRGLPSLGAFAHAPAPVPAREDPMKAVERLIDAVAETDLAVLLLGEAGVGKTFTAEAIHSRSGRAAGPLLRLNCAALPEPLLEGELFGYDHGTFTAVEAKPGLLETASGGALLLEEVGDLPLSTQEKLVGALESREVVRLGGSRPRPFDVRLLVSGSDDLPIRVSNGSFRRDLYHWLDGITLVIPSLRERKGEASRFASKFLMEAASKSGRPTPRLSNEALGVLVHHPFPGNLRELKSTMERACVLARGGYIGPEHLFFDTLPGVAAAASRPPPSAASVRRFTAVAPTEPPEPTQEIMVPVIIPAAPRAPVLPDAVDAEPVTSPSRAPIASVPELERERILSALEQFKGNQTRAAEALGISRRALSARIDQYGLPRPRKR